MDSRITVRFYRIEKRSADQPEFSDCLGLLEGKDEDALLATVGEIEMGVLDFSKDGSFFSGDLARRQTENLPTILQPHEKPKNLELPAGGALGHHTAFRYDTRTKMLGYQLTRNAVPMSHFNLYVATKAECETFHFVPCFDPAKLQDLAHLRPRTILIKVAEPHDLEAIEDKQRELRDSLIQLKEFAQGAYITVQIGLGRKRGQLDKGNVRSTIGWLLEQWAKKRGKISRMKLTGISIADDGEDIDLDFLRAHLGDTETLDFKGLTPAQNYQARADLLRKIMTRHSATLRVLSEQQ